MKGRRFSLLMAALCSVFLFCSCKKEEAERPDLNYDYSLCAEISSDDMMYSADISNVSGQWKITYSSPAELSGMEITLEDKSCGISFNGLEMKTDREKLPSAAIPSLITKALDCAAHSSSVTFTESGGIVTACGVVDGADFTLTFENGSPKKLSVGGNSFTAELSDFKKLV